tara:strand:+ start:27 stop:1718 length:1692 start_codon:yes stop_codon:yes gene_type:complete
MIWVDLKVRKVILNFILVVMSFSLLTSQDWEQSFSAGGFDVNGLFMGGSEVLHLVPHKNKLFASIGYWQDENNVWYGGSDLSIGWSQIICLENEDDSWKVDFDLGYNYLRPEILKQVIFTKDYSGISLDVPDTLLIVGAYSPNYILGTAASKIFIRDDVDGSWDQILVYEGDFSSGESYSMRDIEIYTDQVTGIENLIISVGTQGIFSGKYNPNVDGKIEIGLIPEIGPLGIRPLGITIANNHLYFSSGNKIFKRNDGYDPSYEVVHNFNDLSSYINSAVGGIRGLSTIPNPSGSDESMLLMWCPDGQSKGTIFRLDPVESQEFDRVYETKISLLVEDYLIGETVDYLLGAYNEFYLFTDPTTNIDYNIIGIESLLQENIYPSWNGFYSGGIIVLRDNNGQYILQEINGSIDFDDNPLVSVRCYVESPFENESSMYFGGFDPNGHTSTNNAWVYKRTWSTLDVDEQKSQSIINYKVHNNYPNPFNPSTNIPYTILKDEFINIVIYDLIGNRVKLLVNEYKEIGSYIINWNGKNENDIPVSAGVYLYSIEAGEFKQTKKMILLK